MTIENISSIMGIIVGCISLLYTFTVVTNKISKMEVKVDTLWEFLLRRGRVEAIEKGIGEMHSPLEYTEEIKDWACKLELGKKIKEHCSSLKDKTKDSEMAYEIEKKFGEDIVLNVCIPKKISMGACLVLAVDLVKGKMERRKINTYYKPERRKI